MIGRSVRVAATARDAESASRIYAASWRAAYRGLLSDSLLGSIADDFWASTFMKSIETARFEVSILSVDGQDAGAGAAGRSRDTDDSSVGEITSIYLLPAYWGAGHGAALLGHMLDSLERQGFSHSHLWMLQENERAARFYTRMGFSPSGSTRPLKMRGETVTEIEYVNALTPINNIR